MFETGINPWHITELDFLTERSQSDKLRFLLNYAVLAPSGHNTQPWLFRVGEDWVEIHADKSRALPVIDPGHRELIMSCGAALLNLRLALRHFGYQPRIELLPDSVQPDLMARVLVGDNAAATAEEDSLFAMIPHRRTNRQAFADRPVPPSLLAELQAAASAEGAWLHIVESAAARRLVADLITVGDYLQGKDLEFRRELEACIRPARSSEREGIPTYALGEGGAPAYVAPLSASGHLSVSGHSDGAEDSQVAAGLPVLAVMGTEANHPRDWLLAGQALERVLLRARADEVWASFLNHPVEVAGLWPELRGITGRGGFPQFLLRFGYAADSAVPQPTPRRTVDEVIIDYKLFQKLF